MIDRYQTKLKQIADKKREIKSKFDFLYTKKINSLNIKKKKILLEIKSRTFKVSSTPLNLKKLSEKDLLFKQYKIINEKIKYTRSEIDILYIEEIKKFTHTRGLIIEKIKVLNKKDIKKNKTKKKRIKNLKPIRGSNRLSLFKAANVKGSFELLKNSNIRPTPINRQAARAVGIYSKKKK